MIMDMVALQGQAIPNPTPYEPKAGGSTDPSAPSFQDYLNRTKEQELAAKMSQTASPETGEAQRNVSGTGGEAPKGETARSDSMDQRSSSSQKAVREEGKKEKRISKDGSESTETGIPSKGEKDRTATVNRRRFLGKPVKRLRDGRPMVRMTSRN